MSPLRTAIVGVGIAGRSHLLDAVTQPAVEVVAVVGRRIERRENAAEEFGIARAWSSLDELFAREKLDAVVVATPIRVMGAQVLSALRKGVLVLAEKPGSASVRPLAEMAELESAGRRLSIAYNRRYRSGWRLAREWIAAGRLGEIRRIELCLDAPYAERYSAHAPTFRSNPAESVAGVLLDSGSHAIDAIYFLFGRCGRALSAELTLDRYRRDVAASVRFLGAERAPHAEIEVRLEESMQERKSTCIIGDRGALSLDGERVSLETKEGVEEHPDQDVCRPIDDLVALAEGRQSLGASVHEAAETVRALSNAYRCAGRPLLRSWLPPRAKPLARRNGAC